MTSLITGVGKRCSVCSLEHFGKHRPYSLRSSRLTSYSFPCCGEVPSRLPQLLPGLGHPQEWAQLWHMSSPVREGEGWWIMFPPFFPWAEGSQLHSIKLLRRSQIVKQPVSCGGGQLKKDSYIISHFFLVLFFSLIVHSCSVSSSP